MRSTKKHPVRRRVRAVAALSLLGQASAFSFLPYVARTSHTSNNKNSAFGWNSMTSRRSAIIYNPQDGISYQEERASPALYVDNGPVRTIANIVQDLSKDQADLAEMACAFAPMGHNLQLKDIEFVHVLNVGISHLDLSAVLCQNAGCITVAVPVIFQSLVTKRRALALVMPTSWS
jgi:hypothetical protein